MNLNKRQQIFISYARIDSDEKKRLRKELFENINPQQFVIWDDSRIEPGKYEKIIRREIRTSNIYLLLISQDFIKSEFIKKELLWIRKQLDKDQSKLLVPLLLKDLTKDEVVKRLPLISTYQIYPKGFEVIHHENIDSDLAWSKTVSQIAIAILNNNPKRNKHKSLLYFIFSVLALLFLGIYYSQNPISGLVPDAKEEFVGDSVGITEVQIPEVKDEIPTKSPLEFDPCSAMDCLHGGTCQEGKCKCPEGYTGLRCETKRGGNAQIKNRSALFPGCDVLNDNLDSLLNCSKKYLDSYIKDNYVYPAIAKAFGSGGEVKAEFYVETDGTISGIELIEDIGWNTGNALVNVINGFHDNDIRWIPAIENGVKVRSKERIILDLRIKPQKCFKISSNEEIAESHILCFTLRDNEIKSGYFVNREGANKESKLNPIRRISPSIYESSWNDEKYVIELRNNGNIMDLKVQRGSVLKFILWNSKICNPCLMDS